MQSEVEALLAAYEGAWSGGRMSAVAELFEPGEDIVYVAEEIAEPMIGASAIEAYLRACEASIDWAKIRAGAPRIQAISGEAAALFFEMTWLLKVKGAKAPLAGEARVSAVVRSSPRGLRFIHYVEAPLGALPFVRRTYERHAAMLLATEGGE